MGLLTKWKERISPQYYLGKYLFCLDLPEPGEPSASEREVIP